MSDSRPLILGAGPAGLACADELCRRGIKPRIIDKNVSAGGLCRTLEYEGFFFDIGGHRFLSKSEEVNRLWREVLGDDLLRVKRKSRIYYRDRFFSYPLDPINAMATLGVAESARCLSSYISSRWSADTDDSHFEGWMTRRFGKRLYEIFFKTYTEKVWGIPCTDLSSDWAVQRIEGLSLRKAVLKKLSGGNSPRTTSGEFLYPRRGPGLFCERWKSLSEARGAVFSMGVQAEEIRTVADRVTEVTVRGRDGKVTAMPVEHLFSSIPLPLLVQKMSPSAPTEVLRAAASLRFRNFIVVNLIFKKASVFPDNWIYVHSPGIRAARIQNYKNWSPEMVPDPSFTSLGVEYFATEGDELWKMSEDRLMKLALSELETMRLASADDFVKGFTVKIANVYPVYGPLYRDNVNIVRGYLSGFRNLSVMGREGLFRYDNSDHAILTGLYAARNYLGSRHEDVWSVNTEQMYHEAPAAAV